MVHRDDSVVLAFLVRYHLAGSLLPTHNQFRQFLSYWPFGKATNELADAERLVSAIVALASQITPDGTYCVSYYDVDGLQFASYDAYFADIIRDVEKRKIFRQPNGAGLASWCRRPFQDAHPDAKGFMDIDPSVIQAVKHEGRASAQELVAMTQAFYGSIANDAMHRGDARCDGEERSGVNSKHTGKPHVRGREQHLRPPRRTLRHRQGEEDLSESAEKHKSASKATQDGLAWLEKVEQEKKELREREVRVTKRELAIEGIEQREAKLAEDHADFETLRNEFEQHKKSLNQQHNEMEFARQALASQEARYNTDMHREREALRGQKEALQREQEALQSQREAMQHELASAEAESRQKARELNVAAHTMAKEFEAWGVDTELRMRSYAMTAGIEWDFRPWVTRAPAGAQCAFDELKETTARHMQTD